MSLVSHNEQYRNLWMFPRNIRRIEPWKISQILVLFMQYIDNCGTLRGNQDIQNSFCKALENAGLKKAGFQYDEHSGGIRTYLAQIKSLGLIFTRNDGSVWLTKAGQDIIGGKPPLPIMQNLLLRYQYPSIYSLGRNVKIHPAIKIKPFLFVLQVLMDKNISSLSNEELALLVIYGHNTNCLNLCIQKIMDLRSGRSLKDIIDPADCYTPRTRDRSIDKAISDILDIANTCKNYLQACCLIYTEKHIGQTERIYINTDMMPVIEKALLTKDSFIQVKNEEAFQRTFGAWDNKKDTRILIKSCDTNINNAKKAIITANYFKYAGNHLITRCPQDFIDKMNYDFGFSKEQVMDAISPYLYESLTYFESHFIELSKGGVLKAVEFEKAVNTVFENCFNFNSRHTGQLKRKSSSVGGYSDILLYEEDLNMCALLDAKASSNYNLTSDDYYKMKDNYMKNYHELVNKNTNLEFCSYVAGGFSSGFKNKIRTLTAETGIPVSGISAYELLNLAKIEGIKERKTKIINLFKNNSVISLKEGII